MSRRTKRIALLVYEATDLLGRLRAEYQIADEEDGGERKNRIFHLIGRAYHRVGRRLRAAETPRGAGRRYRSPMFLRALETLYEKRLAAAVEYLSIREARSSEETHAISADGWNPWRSAKRRDALAEELRAAKRVARLADALSLARRQLSDLREERRSS